ncbi:hypothetical protein HDF24_11095 [Mucilaginibacter sp. X4EP1]|uniref:hypothetical protein n=1 Tax=Mucilaginibacter sp. X4EP1 TaxID=2723092 RepID=UPI002169E389|nr:hypothetical protein [Mucilaginibacter sp. X4EP1]MCS3815551.1 energy-converting hydrogenase Eha subunit E [Mucilaginibacter sp. X4EP1]
MAHYISGMPLWAIILFVISFLYSITFIAKPAKQAALNAGMSANKARNIQFGILGFYVIYLAYVSCLALMGVFDVNTVLPKPMIWAGIPLLIFLFGFIGNTPLFKKLLKAVSLESLIALHVFRLVGVFFIILYFYHLLPGKFAFSAEMGDVITALLAIPVARMVSKGNRWAKPVVYAWNIFGMLDIINLLTIAVINATNPAFIGGQGDLREMLIFPFVWFPAFAPATILFLHVMIFRKMYQLGLEDNKG